MDFQKMKKMEEILLEKRILLIGNINRDEQTKFNTNILYLNLASTEKEITIFIDSDGGDVEAGMMMFDAIKASKAPVNAIVCGFCKSAGFVILQACNKRKILPHAQLMFHYPKMRISINFDVQKEKEKLLKLHNSIFDLSISRANSKISRDGFQKMVEEEEYISSEDALALGLIDKIIEKIDF